MNEPLVIVLEPYERVDISAAEEYGDITYVFQSGERPSIWDTNFANAVLTRLAQCQFNPSTDYVLVVGHMARLALAIDAIAAHYAPQRLALLFWNAEAQHYQGASDEIITEESLPRGKHTPCPHLLPISRSCGKPNRRDRHR